MTKNTKIIIICALFIISLAGGIGIAFNLNTARKAPGQTATSAKDQTSSQPSAPTPAKQSDIARFIATGDNLIHGAIYNEARARGHGEYNFDYPYQYTAPYFQSFDFKYINQETLVNDAASPSHYPRFSTPLALGDKVASMGFNIINTANNHSYDQDAAGVKSSYAYWGSKGPNLVHIGFYTGDDQKDIKYLTKNNIKLGLIACTYATNGLTLSDPSSPHIIACDDFTTLDRLIKIAKQNSDALIVSAHWGNEDSTTISAYQYSVADHLADVGVDADVGKVVGNHPHVIQSIEWRKGPNTGHKTLICYSLGNFISAQFPAKNLVGGLFQFDIVKTYHSSTSTNSSDDNNKDFTISFEHPAFVPVVTHYDPNGEHTKNIRNYLLRDYTPALGNAHGAHSRGFSYDYALQHVKEIIPAEFLKLD